MSFIFVFVFCNRFRVPCLKKFLLSLEKCIVLFLTSFSRLFSNILISTACRFGPFETLLLIRIFYSQSSVHSEFFILRVAFSSSLLASDEQTEIH